jgi:hypothetical protein
MAFVALGGDAGGSRPTYFEAYAAAALVPSLRSATVYALSVAARRSSSARLALTWEDEACLVASLLLDWHSLRSTGGTFAESIYGLRRERMVGGRRRGAAAGEGGGGVAGGGSSSSRAAVGGAPPPSPRRPLSRRDVAAALATEALVPYLLVKFDRLHAWLLPYVTAARRRRLQLLQEQDRERRLAEEEGEVEEGAGERAAAADAAASSQRARAIALAAAQLAAPGGGGGLVGLATARAAALMAMAEARRARRQREARQRYAAGEAAGAAAAVPPDDHDDADPAQANPLLPGWMHALLRAMAAPLAAASNAAPPVEEQDPDAHAAFRRRHELAERLVAASERAARAASRRARAARAAASAAASAARETRACRATQVAGLSLLLSLYPLARSALEMARFGYQANYLLAPLPGGAGRGGGGAGGAAVASTTPTPAQNLLPPSPLMHLAGQRLVRTSGTEVALLSGQLQSQRRAQLDAWGTLSPRAAAAAAAASGAGPPAQLAAAAVAAGAAARARLLRAGHLASDNARSGLILALFGFKALEWWFSSAEARLAATRALPPPPAPKPPPPHPRGCGLPASADGAGAAPPCPLCRRAPKAAPSALAVSGYVFCYACVFAHVSEHGCCPVTLMPARLDDIRKLYEQ